ncbi:Uncharacterized protein FKW44_005454 [Caligus rogercresseyi]|uniref:DUF659 domain-containing protein n=1 Tax=Caligus rogercresseyi TaxID=217165 RepID=A0A7T8KC02_CALRO|nr:Uncharacterized protein FKW44_005454 [Caligus rogercresseyi]
MEKESKVNMNKVKERLQDQRLFVLVDKCGRAMTAVLSGPLDGRFKDRSFLLDLLFGENFDYNSLHLLVTDEATYCLKAGRGLKELFPNMMYVTCICHALNREFVKAPRRKKALAASGQLPPVPEPYLTSLPIVKAKKLLKDSKLPGQLVFIKGNFTQLVRVISSLQERLPLTESIGILERVQMQLNVEPFTLELKDDPKLPFLFSCAPITSVDCERVFSKLSLFCLTSEQSDKEACKRYTHSSVQQ